MDMDQTRDVVCVYHLLLGFWFTVSSFPVLLITMCPFNIACFGQLDHTKFPIFRHTHTIEIQLWVSLMMNNEDNEVLQD